MKNLLTLNGRSAPPEYASTNTVFGGDFLGTLEEAALRVDNQFAAGGNALIGSINLSMISDSRVLQGVV